MLPSFSASGQRIDWLTRIAALALAALAGASAWVSLGTMAVADVATTSRLAAVPSLWWLLATVLAASVAAFTGRLSLARAWPLAITFLLWLPYLPFRVPAAFLIWEGPLEIAVWCAVLAGLCSQPPTPWRRLSPMALDPKLAPWLAGIATLALGLATFGAVRGVIPGGDEPHYLAETQSLLLDHDLRVENNYSRGDYLAYFPGRLRPDYLRRGSDGEIYSIHAPGLSVVVLPVFAIAGYPGAVVTVIIVAALAAVLTWQTAWLLTASAAGAWAGWAAVFLTTPFLFHTFAIYPDGVGALLVVAGVWLLVRLETRLPVSQAALAAVGVGLAMLPWLHTRFSLIAAGIGLALVLRLWSGPGRAGRLAALLAVPLLSATAWFGFFWLIWGTPSPSAPYGADTNSAIGYVGRGLAGLIVDQQFGLIATAPIYAVAVAGMWSLARRHPRLAGELLLISIPYVLTSSSYAMWWGGTSAPARFLVALLPLAAIPIAWLWSRQSAAARTVTLILLLVSALMTLPRALADEGRLLYNSRTGFDLALDWTARSVDLPLGLPSVHRDGVAGAVTDALPWLAAGLLMAGVVRVVAWRSSPPTGAIWAIATLAGASGAMLALTIVWTRHDPEVITPNRSSVAALSAFRSHAYSTAFRLEPFGVIPIGSFTGRLPIGSTDRPSVSSANPTAVRIAALPAGDYQVVTTGGEPSRSEWDVAVGRNDPPIERWRLADQTAAPASGDKPSGLSGNAGYTLRLPVDLSAVTIRNAHAEDRTATVQLRATAVRAAANPDGRRAIRATRYGTARVFFFDDQAYLEPTGFWTRAGGAAIVVIDVDEAARAQGLRLLVRAGAVPTTIDVSVGDWRRSLVLAAGQEELVALPEASAALAVTLRSGAGFRPSAVDPASDDVRHLAAWVEVR